MTSGTKAPVTKGFSPQQSDGFSLEISVPGQARFSDWFTHKPTHNKPNRDPHSQSNSRNWLDSQKIAIAEKSLHFQSQSAKSQVLPQKNRQKIAENIAEKSQRFLGVRIKIARFRVFKIAAFSGTLSSRSVFFSKLGWSPQARYLIPEKWGLRSGRSRCAGPKWSKMVKMTILVKMTLFRTGFWHSQDQNRPKWFILAHFGPFRSANRTLATPEGCVIQEA